MVLSMVLCFSFCKVWLALSEDTGEIAFQLSLEYLDCLVTDRGSSFTGVSKGAFPLFAANRANKVVTSPPFKIVKW